MWNRATLDNQHRTVNNKCCTISHKARNRRPRKQMWFTSRHIKCWYFPPRKDRCKTAVLPTLDVQPLNKTHHTHSTLLANHRRDGFVKSHVRSDNKFPNSCCGQNQQPQARCEHECGGVRTHQLSDAHTKKHTGRMAPQMTNSCGADLARETWHNQQMCASRLHA